MIEYGTDSFIYDRKYDVFTSIKEILDFPDDPPSEITLKSSRTGVTKTFFRQKIQPGFYIVYGNSLDLWRVIIYNEDAFIKENLLKRRMK